MKIKKRQIVCLSLVSAVIAPLLWSCKPTEKNYKAAYDVAVKKREMSADPERAEGHRVISVDGPRMVSVGNRVYALVTDFLKSTDESATPAPQPHYRVAVGRYQMPTNARAQVADLRGNGYPDAELMRDGKDRYYVVAAGFDRLEDAAACVKSLMEKFPSTMFVGLDGNPLIIEHP